MPVALIRTQLTFLQLPQLALLLLDLGLDLLQLLVEHLHLFGGKNRE
jgi:hypothetical protein